MAVNDGPGPISTGSSVDEPEWASNLDEHGKTPLDIWQLNGPVQTEPAADSVYCWSMTFEQFLQAVQTVFIALAGIAAWRGVDTWRQQLSGKRRMEIAEETLTTIYEARNVLTWARNGMSFEGEAYFGDEPAEGEERDYAARMRDSYYVPVARLSKQHEVFSKLSTQEHLCAIYFGEAVREHFARIREVQTRVSISARALIRDVGRPERPRDEERNRKRQQRYEDEIWGGLIEDDPLTIQTNEAVGQIEIVCLPHLRTG